MIVNDLTHFLDLPEEPNRLRQRCLDDALHAFSAATINASGR